MAKPDTVLANAMSAHQAGRFEEARVGYQRVLRKQPNHPDALHFFGLLHFQRGNMAQGEALIRRSIAYAAGNPHAWNNLGNIVRATGRAADAKAIYTRVIELAPDMAEPHYNLGLLLRDERDFAGAIRHLGTAVNLGPAFWRAYETLGMLLYRLGEVTEAAEIYRRWTAADPANAIARHMAAATSGLDVPARADDAYVAKYFDKFAAGFDSNLKELGYRAPELVSYALAREAGLADARLDVLDAGCGTGLCGPLLKPYCRHLRGVDLSAGMLDLARARGGYDELVVQELSQYMREHPAAFDAIVSADTLIYFGPLEDPCAAAHAALRTAGLLIFTLEALSDDAADEHRLQAHGRYAHRESYVRKVLLASGFELASLARETLRTENGQDVIGHLVVARKAG